MENLERKLVNLCFAGGAIVGIVGALIAGGLSIYDAKLGKEIGTQVIDGGVYIMVGLLCAGSYFGSRNPNSDKKERD